MSIPRNPGKFIRQNLTLRATPGLPDLLLYSAHPGSGLSRIAGPQGAAPYWAYCWAGGLALAHYLQAHPQLARSSRHLLDFGAGSGLVAIAAAQTGASQVSAAETDPWARAAIHLNAKANGVAVTLIEHDLTEPAQPLPQCDVVLAGDVFYAPDRAHRVLTFLARCAAAGALVLIGDPGRPALPRAGLTQLASYGVRDVGDPPGASTLAQVYQLTF